MPTHHRQDQAWFQISCGSFLQLGCEWLCLTSCCDLTSVLTSMCQPRRAGRSLYVQSVKTLVHAYVASRVDYCNSVLASALTSWNPFWMLQHAWSVGLRSTSVTVPQRKTVHRCLHHSASIYLTFCSFLVCLCLRQTSSTVCSTCMLQHLREAVIFLSP